MKQMYESHWFCPKCHLTENGLVNCIGCKREPRIFEYVCNCPCHSYNSTEDKK